MSDRFKNILFALKDCFEHMNDNVTESENKKIKERFMKEAKKKGVELETKSVCSMKND